MPSDSSAQPRSDTYKKFGGTEETILRIASEIRTRLPVIEQSLETAALMLGTDKSRGYCLEMICADFLAGAHLGDGNPATLLMSVGRLIELLPDQLKTDLRQQMLTAS